ncbi:MAG: endonuclease domain-containing protein [Rhodomicrobium sp.]
MVEQEGPRTGLARKLRRQETDAERKLWSRIRDRQFLGLKFRRQVPVCGYVADFLCHEAKLIVELDGGQHAERGEEDTLRTKTLNEAGFLVLRFWNNDVLANTDGVLTALVEELQAAERTIEGLAPHPVPLPMGEGTMLQGRHP